MKKIFLISSIFIIAFGANAYSKSGFGVDLSVPLGAGIGYFEEDGKKSSSLKSDAGFEFGVYLKPNGYLDLSVLSLGLSLDLGYQRDVFAYKYGSRKGALTFDSLSVGLMPKIDVLFLSIGLGAGVKFPLGGSYTYITDDSGGRTLEKYDYNKLKEKFGDKLYVPYLKTSLDFMMLPNVALGIYVSFDFPIMEYQNIASNVDFAGFDIGGQITLRF